MRFRNLVCCVLLLSSFMSTAFSQQTPTIATDLRLRRTADPNGTYAFRQNGDGILRSYNTSNVQTSSWNAQTGTFSGTIDIDNLSLDGTISLIDDLNPGEPAIELSHEQVEPNVGETYQALTLTNGSLWVGNPTNLPGNGLSLGYPGSVTAEYGLFSQDLHSVGTTYGSEGVVVGRGRQDHWHDGSLIISSQGQAIGGGAGEGEPLAGTQVSRMYTDNKGLHFENDHIYPNGSISRVFDFDSPVHIQSDLMTSGSVTGSSFSGNGASLTDLNALNLGSGTVPDARFPTTLPAVSGANLTNLDATDLTGTIADARLSGNVALKNIVNTFTTNQTIYSFQPQLVMVDTFGVNPDKSWKIVNYNGSLWFSETGIVDTVQVHSSGVKVTGDLSTQQTNLGTGGTGSAGLQINTSRVLSDNSNWGTVAKVSGPDAGGLYQMYFAPSAATGNEKTRYNFLTTTTNDNFSEVEILLGYASAGGVSDGGLGVAVNGFRYLKRSAIVMGASTGADESEATIEFSNTPFGAETPISYPAVFRINTNSSAFELNTGTAVVNVTSGAWNFLSGATYKVPISGAHDFQVNGVSKLKINSTGFGLFGVTPSIQRSDSIDDNYTSLDTFASHDALALQEAYARIEQLEQAMFAYGLMLEL